MFESLPDRLGIRAVDACLELEFHLGRPFITAALRNEDRSESMVVS